MERIRLTLLLSAIWMALALLTNTAQAQHYRVLRLAGSGTTQTNITLLDGTNAGSPLPATHSIAVRSNGDIYFSAGGTIFYIEVTNPSGNAPLAGNYNNFAGMNPGSTNNGTLADNFGFGDVNDIAFDSSGDLFVTDNSLGGITESRVLEPQAPWSTNMRVEVMA